MQSPSPEASQEGPAGAPANQTGAARLAPTAFAGRLRQARSAANKTQQQLAGGTYSKSYISAIERGKMIPSVQALHVLAERLGVPMSFFLGEGEVDFDKLVESDFFMRSLPEHTRQQREEAARVTLQAAEGWIRRGEPDKALEELDTTIDRPSEDVSPCDQPRRYWLIGLALMRKQVFQDAMGWLERGLHLIENLRGQVLSSEKAQLDEMAERLRNSLGNCYYELGQGEMALEYHRHCLTAISNGAITDPALKLLIYQSLGNDYLMLGHHQDAISFYHHSIKQADSMTDPRQQGLAYWLLGLTYKSSGDLFHARASFQKALIIFEMLDTMHLGIQLHSMLGRVLAQMGDYEEAEKNLHLSLQAAERIDDAHTREASLENIAYMHLTRGDADQAITAAQDGLALARQSEDHLAEGRLHLLLAEAHEAREDASTAEQTYKDAIATLEQTNGRELLSRAHERYGQFLAEQERFQEAYEQLQSARTFQARRA